MNFTLINNNGTILIQKMPKAARERITSSVIVFYIKMLRSKLYPAISIKYSATNLPISTQEALNF